MRYLLVCNCGAVHVSMTMIVGYSQEVGERTWFMHNSTPACHADKRLPAVVVAKYEGERTITDEEARALRAVLE